MSSQSCELCRAMLFSSQAQEQCKGVISLGDREAAFGKWIYTPALAAVGVVIMALKGSKCFGS